MINNVYIALGSNLGDPLAQLTRAVQTLNQHPELKIKSVSPFYGSKPLGPQDQPDYINAVVQIETELEPLALLDLLQSIENDQGRVRLRRWGERTLDLDILLFNQEVILHPRLIVPHCEMKNREFVIIPLFDIAPNLVFPDGELLSETVKKFRPHQMWKLSN